MNTAKKSKHNRYTTGIEVRLSQIERVSLILYHKMTHLSERGCSKVLEMAGELELFQ